MRDKIRVREITVLKMKKICNENCQGIQEKETE